MKKQLQIRIYPNGEIKAETIGILGKKCTNYIEVVEKLLAAKITNSEFTNDYYLEERNELEDNSQVVRRNENGNNG